MDLSILDIIIIIAWLLITLGAGIYAGAKTDPAGYWANKRSTSIPLLVFTLVSTQVGAGAIIGIASATFSNGTGFGLVSLVSTVTGFLVMSYFTQALKRFGDRYQALTLPDLFRVRYGRATQFVGSLIILFTYLSLLAAQFLATSTTVSLGTGISLKVAIIFAVVGVIFYSAFAGIKGDIVTDALHFWAMAIILLFVLFPLVNIEYPISNWFSSVPSEIWSPVTFGGYSFLILGLLLGAIIPMLQPELWIKIYASRSARDGQAAMFLSALAVIPFYLMALFLGLVGHTVYPASTNGDLIVFKLLADIMPAGFLGFGIAAILAIIISTANTLIVIIGATLLRDLLNRNPWSIENLKLSRIITGACGVIGAILAITVPSLVQLLLNAFYMLLVLGPALIGVAVWKRATATAATSSIVIGAMATLIFLFIAPREAFLPGLILSSLSFVVISFFTKHSGNETTDAKTIFG